MRKLTKLFSTSLLVGCLILSTSVQAFASTENKGTKISVTNTNQAVLPIAKQGNRPIYSGKIKDMPKDLYDSIVKNKPTFSGIDGNTDVKIMSGYKTYTYTTAPENIRKEHEANCKATGKTPNPLDSISVPYVANTISFTTIATATINPFIIVGRGSDSRGEFIFVDDLNDVRHKAYIYSDYVGYNHITTGDPVVVAQYLLNRCGYSLSVDGIFGPNTRSAVQSFQSSKNLSVDGIIGPNTWNSLLL